MNIQPIIEGQYFHIYNRGVNREDLFKSEKNYSQFLEKYSYYCSEILETLAYCLLKNHFHLLARVRENVEVPRRDGKEGMFRLNASKQLGHCFNAYAQSINSAYKRTGPLFESPFERKWVDDKSYLRHMVFYCHSNPVHHGFTKDVRDWEHSSYHSILNGDNSLVAADTVMELFGGIEQFEAAHQTLLTKPGIENYYIEYE